MSTRVLFALLFAGHLTLSPAASHAQQAPRAGSTSPARGGYFARVQTDAGIASSSSGGSRTRLRFDATRSLDGRASLASTEDSYRGESDPLRAYGSEARDGRTTRPYERPPAVSPPERVAPAPAPSHNYYPTLRTGQGFNRNVGSVGAHAHCVPGRGAFLHR